MIAPGELQLLRPVLELAWAVARAGDQQHPRRMPPKPLRPFLRFAKLPDRALEAARRSLDEVDEFRLMVAVGADEATVGRAGELFVTRPDGWEREFDRLVAIAAEVESAEHEEHEERTARRKLRGAEEARRQAEDALASAALAAGRASADLAAEREARRGAEASAIAAVAEVERLRAESGSFRAAAERARAERERLTAELERVEAELARARARATPVVELPVDPVAPPTVVPLQAAEPPTLASPEPVTPPVDLEELSSALRDAALAFTQLGAAMERASGALGSTSVSSPRPAPAGPAADAVSTTGEGAGRARPEPVDPGATWRVADSRPAPVSIRRRTPAPLPPAVFDDSPAAADHLVRLNGVVLLVDGYNVSKLRWPELPLPEQRRRLVDALGELAARTGADVHVVFDGAAQVEPPPPPARRRMVRVTFSPPDVEADDVIVSLIDDVPLQRPVVVASSDRRVQAEAAALGANVISSPQLLAAGGR